GHEPAHGVPDEHGLAKGAQAVVHVLDVVQHGEAADVANGAAAGVPAQVERPRVPARLGGGIQPVAQVPAPSPQSVCEGGRAGGRRVLEKQVVDRVYGETALSRTVSSTMEAVVWRSFRSTHSLTVWMSRMPQARLATSMPRVV